MVPDLVKYEDITNVTYKVAEAIDADFYRLRSSYKSLNVYEHFIEILKNRGFGYNLDFDLSDYAQIKSSIISQLAESVQNRIFSPNEMIVEAFYLGNLCSTLVYANVPVPTQLQMFGKSELVMEELKD